MSDWTHDELTTLARLWKDGKSAREITADLPQRSRSSILGQVNRMGMTGQARKVPPRKAFVVSRVDNDHRIAVILDVQRHGGTSRDAALRLGLRPDTARKAALRLGVPFGTETRCKAPRKPHSAAKTKPGTRDRKSVKAVHQAPLRRRGPNPEIAAYEAQRRADGAIPLIDAPMVGRCKAFLHGEAGAYGLTCAASIPIGASWCPAHRRIVFDTSHPSFVEAAE